MNQFKKQEQSKQVNKEGQIEKLEQLSLVEKTRKSPKQCRKISISHFRHLIELVHHVAYTAVVLDGESKKKLKTCFPCPKGWLGKADHVTVCLGPGKEWVEKMGGLNTTHRMVVTHFGQVQGKVQALLIQSDTILSFNEKMHITLAISQQGQSKDSNDITEWTVVEQLDLQGTLQEVKRWGHQQEKAVAPVKQPVSIGEIVMKHHPHLQGSFIGKACKRVEEWMGKTFMENSLTNKPNIEWYIQSMDTQDL